MREYVTRVGRYTTVPPHCVILESATRAAGHAFCTKGPVGHLLWELPPLRAKTDAIWRFSARPLGIRLLRALPPFGQSTQNDHPL